MGKLVIALIFGGKSVEHEISILSAKAVMNHVDRTRFDVTSIYVDKAGVWRRPVDEQWHCGEGGVAYDPGRVVVPLPDPPRSAFLELDGRGQVAGRFAPDVVFPVVHGTGGEDGSLQGLLETMDIPYVGAGVLGSALAMDKIVSKALLRQAGLPVVPYTWFYKHEWGDENRRRELVERIVDAVGTPCFVKAADLGSSVGIVKVEERDDVASAVDVASRFSHRILAERAVVGAREIEVSVLGNEEPIASLPGEIVPRRGFYDYRAKYVDDEGAELIAPAELDDELTERVRTLAVESFRVLDCAGMARVDFLLEPRSGELFVSELNTIPGFTRISMYPRLWEVTGIRFSGLITRLVGLAIERRRLRRALETDFDEKIEP